MVIMDYKCSGKVGGFTASVSDEGETHQMLRNTFIGAVHAFFLNKRMYPAKR
jgi:hypothetical protein